MARRGAGALGGEATEAGRVDGIGPLRPFSDSDRVVRFVRLLSSAGIGPCRSLSASDSSVNRERLASSGGISAPRLFDDNDRVVRLSRLASSAGIGPQSQLPSSDSSVSPVRDPISGGIGPFSLLLLRSSSIRDSNPTSQVMEPPVDYQRDRVRSAM